MDVPWEEVLSSLVYLFNGPEEIENVGVVVLVGIHGRGGGGGEDGGEEDEEVGEVDLGIVVEVVGGLDDDVVHAAVGGGGTLLVAAEGDSGSFFKLFGIEMEVGGRLYNI